MKRYSSGYVLISLNSLIGWITIIFSIIGGIIIVVNAERGLEFIGFIVMVAGPIQGLILLGFGAVGKAILDGSLAQQDSLSSIKEIAFKLNQNEDFNKNITTQRTAPYNPPDFSKVTPMRPVEDMV
jgi:hypothetical protein